MAQKTSTTKPVDDGLLHETDAQRPLAKRNYIYMAVSFAVIILGFLLMLGSGNDSGEFNPEIFSVRRVVVGPTIAFLGFIAMGVSIIIPSKKSK